MADKKIEILVTADDQASGILSGIGKNVSNLNSHLQTVAKGFVAIGAVSAAALGGSVKAAIDWESAFAGVRKTVDGTQEDFKRLEKGLLDMSKQIPVSAKELAGIAESAGQLGVARDDILAFTETMAKLGATTNLTSEEAATSMAQIANVMKLPVSDIDNLGAALVQLGNNGASTERDILEFAKRISGAGAVAGLTSQNLLGIGNAFASVGVEAEAGGTAVQKVLLNMNQAVVMGGDQLNTFAKTSGVTSAQFKKQWEADPAKAFTMFVEGLGKSGDQAFNILDELGMTDARLVSSFLRVANAGDLLRNSIDMGNDSYQKATALEVEFSKRKETTASQIQILKNNMMILGNTIGSALLPAINKLIEATIPLITGFAKFAEEHPRLIAGFLMIGAALGAIGAAMMVIGPIVAFLSSAWVVLGAAATVLGGILMFLLSPIGLIIVAIVALVAAGVWLYQNWEMVAAFAANIWNQIVMIIQGALTTIQQFFMGIWTAILEWFIAFWDNFTNNVVVQMLMNLAMLIFNILMTIQSFWQLVWEVIYQTVLTLLTAVVAVVQALMSAKQAVIQTVMNMIKNIIQTIWNAIKDDIFNMLNQIKNTVTTIWNAIYSFIQQIMNQISNWIKQKMDESANHINNGVQAMKGFFESLMGVINAVINKFNEMANAARNALNAAREAVSAAGANIRGALGFQHGGVVPGSFNQAVPTILHGGERVVSHNGADVGGGGGSGSGEINIIIEGDVNSMDMLDRITEAVKNAIGRDNELARMGASI